MRRSVDPGHAGIGDASPRGVPADVTKEMLSYLRGVRDGTTPQIQMDSQRKVSKEDKAIMARDVKPLLTDLLSDVVRARPRAPVDFSIAWLASRRAQATDVPAPKSVSKLRDAISFDAAVTSQKPTTTLEKKRIFVLGDTMSGKTTPSSKRCRATWNHQPLFGLQDLFDLGHQLSEDAPQSTLTFLTCRARRKQELGGPACFSDCHAGRVCADCSSDLAEARTCFDYCFRATNENEDERRSMLKGKPLLVLACVEIKQ